MAADVQFGGTDTDRVFIGCDVSKAFHVKDLDTDATGATAKNITGWALTFDVRKTDKSGTVLISKTVGSGITIAGTFNSVAATNTQRATLVLSDTDLAATVFTKADTYRYSLKRTDDGSETILAYGDFVVERATQIL